jgi:hypothetical protein
VALKRRGFLESRLLVGLFAGARSEKVVRKGVGVFYNDKNASRNLRIALFNGILGIAELDEVGDF